MNSQEQKDLPLVSIVVLTYNSSKYVLETLDSAYNQTYEGPLELIISDDCSTDDTVDICKEWLRVKSDRFVSVKIVCMPENGGITKNVNQGCRAAQGEWIKPIAGDDILMDSCIEKTVLFAGKNPDAMFISGLVRSFFDGDDISDTTHEKLEVWNHVTPGVIIDAQYHLAKKCEFPPSPAWFFRKSFLEKIGYYPEVIRNVEDFPMLIEALANNCPVYVMYEATVLYRKRKGSLVSLINHDTHKTACEFRYKRFYQHANAFAKLDLFLEKNVALSLNHSFVKKIFWIIKVQFLHLYRRWFVSFYRVSVKQINNNK